METKEIDKSFAKRTGCLLVVMLAAYVFIYPMFAAPPTHYGGSCLSNLKQLTLGNIIYSSDFDDLLPPYYTFDFPAGWDSMAKADQVRSHPAKRFKEAVMPYIKNDQLFLCLVDARESKTTDLVAGREGFPKVMTYVHCLSLKGAIPGYADGKRSLSLGKDGVADPGKVPFFRDPIRGYGTGKDGHPSFFSPHKETFLMTYLDGHAKPTSSLDLNSQL